jgi:hypothetical protein
MMGEVALLPRSNIYSASSSGERGFELDYVSHKVISNKIHAKLIENLQSWKGEGSYEISATSSAHWWWEGLQARREQN